MHNLSGQMDIKKRCLQVRIGNRGGVRTSPWRGSHKSCHASIFGPSLLSLSSIGFCLLYLVARNSTGKRTRPSYLMKCSNSPPVYSTFDTRSIGQTTGNESKADIYTNEHVDLHASFPRHYNLGSPLLEHLF